MRLFDKHKTAHFSVDDTIWLFENLGHFGYQSIFEQPTLGFFKELHNEYGLKVSFYCFGSFQGLTLQDMTAAYRDEFSANSAWLRFGFHGWSDESRNMDVKRAAADYEAVRDELIRIVGLNSLTDFCRLHCFSGSREAVAAMQKCCLKGLLCADDNRSNYYLSAQQNWWLNFRGSYYDRALPMKFIKTDLRIEKIEESFLRNFGSNKGHIEVFTHEWALDDENKRKIEMLCMRLRGLEYKWSFNDER